MTILALDAYAASSAKAIDQLAIDEVRAGAAPKDVSSIQANLVRSGWSAGASRVDFVNGSSLPAWWITSQSGYDRGTSTKAIKNGLEIVRDYTDTDGKPLDKITVGREIDVHLKIRATAGERRQHRDRRPAAGRLRSGHRAPPVTDTQEGRQQRRRRRVGAGGRCTMAVADRREGFHVAAVRGRARGSRGDLRHRDDRRARSSTGSRRATRAASSRRRRRVDVRPPLAGPGARRVDTDGGARAMTMRLNVVAGRAGCERPRVADDVSVRRRVLHGAGRWLHRWQNWIAGVLLVFARWPRAGCGRIRR